MVSHSCNPKTPEEDQKFKVSLNYIKPRVKREQEGGKKARKEQIEQRPSRTSTEH